MSPASISVKEPSV